MPLDWSILQSTGPVDIAGNFARGYKMADDIVTKIHERNALGYLAQNPDDPHAMAQLWQANPGCCRAFRGAQHVQRRKALKDAQDLQRQSRLGSSITSDPQAARTAAAMPGDFDLVKTLSALGDDDRKRVLERFQAAGPLAYQASKLPPEARKQYIEQNREALNAAGWSDEEINRFDPTDAHLRGSSAFRASCRTLFRLTSRRFARSNRVGASIRSKATMSARSSLRTTARIQWERPSVAELAAVREARRTTPARSANPARWSSSRSIVRKRA
jgi:hypothetical protein